jgi:hypothetical protein
MTTPDDIGLPSFTCPCCGMLSYSPGDIRRGYCGRCQWETGDSDLGMLHHWNPCPHRVKKAPAMTEGGSEC